MACPSSRTGRAGGLAHSAYLRSWVGGLMVHPHGAEMHGQAHRGAGGQIRSAGLHRHLPDGQRAVYRPLGQLFEDLGHAKHPDEPGGRAFDEHAAKPVHLVPDRLFPARTFGPGVVGDRLDAGALWPRQPQSKDCHGLLLPRRPWRWSVRLDPWLAPGIWPCGQPIFLCRLHAGWDEGNRQLWPRLHALRGGFSGSCTRRERGHGWRRSPQAWPRDPIALHAIAHRIPAHSQQPCRLCHIAPGLHQRLLNLLGLGREGVCSCHYLGHWRGLGADRWRRQGLTEPHQGCGVDLHPHVQQGDTLHHMAQFPHIPRPSIAGQPGFGLSAEAFGRDLMRGGIMLQ